MRKKASGTDKKSTRTRRAKPANTSLKPSKRSRPSDARVDRSQRRELSTYEKLFTALTPLMDEARLGELSEETVRALSRETGVAEPQVESLTRGAMLLLENEIPLSLLDASVRRLSSSSNGAGTEIEDFFRVAYAAALSHRTGIPEQAFSEVLPAGTRSADDVDPAALRVALSGGGMPDRPPVTSAELDRVMDEVEVLRSRVPFEELALADLASVIPPAERSSLLERLTEMGVTTPAKLLATAGDDTGAWSARLTDAERLGMKALENHAQLGLLNLSGTGRKTLLDAGFVNLTQVASEPFVSFERRIAPVLGPTETARIHATATLQKSFLDNIVTANRLDPRRGLRSISDAASSVEASDDDVADCGCKDCEAATSPAAYLADLLSYSNARLSWQLDTLFPAEPVTTGLLSSLLRQPIADLPTDCASVEEEVSQLRLCIESLVALIGHNLGANPDLACSPLKHDVSFAFAADVDGDGQDELILGFDADFSSMLGARHAVGTGVWVMRYDRTAGRWRHLAPGTDPTAATFYLPPGFKVKFAFAGRFQQDTSGARKDRQQLVLVIKDQGAGGLPVWVLEFDQKRREWKHVNPGPLGVAVQPGGIFKPDVFDFAIASVDVDVAGGFAADVDGDALDELVAYGTTPTQRNAFWVFRQRAQGWERVGPAGTSYNEAFACHTPSGGEVTYPIKLALSGDVDRDGRAEIIAFPDAPGRLGTSPWILKWDAAAGTWNHVLPAGSLRLNADAVLGAAPWPTAQALVGQITGANSAELVVAPDALTAGSDPNRFAVFRYKSPTPPDIEIFDELAAADCSPTRDPVTFAIAADVDGDSRDELVVLTRKAGVSAAWIMDRSNAGTWQHLSPLAGHPLAADLEWTPGGAYPARFAFAADVDGDGQDEVVIVGDTCTEIWVMKYRASKSQWDHVRASDSGEVRYEGAAYLALLAQLGTSYDEVRLARSEGDTTRRALADRLAITLGARTGAAGDRLDQLVCDPVSVTEARLEELFGLVNTHRDPLASVAVSGDPQKQTSHWRLEGLDWSGDPMATTTDDEGRIYVVLGFNTGTGRVTVTLFRDAVRQFAVAMGEGPRTGVLRLSSLNGSGLSGHVKVDYKADTSTIVLTALPQVALWQAMRLREQWDDEDRRADAFSAASGTASAVPLPMIDPDVIGPDDLRLPLPKIGVMAPDGAFDIWRMRRDWVDGILTALRGRQPDLDSMFELLRPPAGAPVPEDYPWHDAPPTAAFAALSDSLSNGDTRSVEQARTTLRSKLHLSVDAFVRLMALRSKKLTATSPLTDAEWDEIRSILAQAYKVSRFDSWRLEERNAALELDGESFVMTASSPSEGPWPPESSATIPLIDPELIAVTDLPVSLAGVEARALFRRRSGELRANAEILRARRSLGLEAVLVEGFGAAPASAPGNWIGWINTWAEQLQRSDPAVVSQAESDIRAAMPGVSLSVFRRMAAVTGRPTGTVLTDAHWGDIDAGAAPARKYRLLYPTWRNEETASGRILYWRARRAALPRWRASFDARTRWEQALRDRTRPPVLDPDYVQPAWIRNSRSRAREIYYGLPVVGAKPGRLRELRLKEDALRGVLAAAPTTLEGLDAAIVEALTPGTESERMRADVAARRQAGGLDHLLGEILGEQVDELESVLVTLNQGDPAAAARTAILRELCFGSVAAFRAVMDAMQTPAGVSAAQWQSIERSLADTATIRWLVRADRRSADGGVKVRFILEQLGFSTSAWRRLCAIRSLAAQGTPALLPEEIEEAIAILMRADKLRRYGRWRAEEHGTGQQIPVRLGPDAFRTPSLASPDEPPSGPPAWRVAPSEARQWQETLDARTAQHRGIFTALRTSVARVEDAVLPLLRDQLVSSLPVPGTESDAAMRWVEDFLLTDPRIGSCRRTTRVAHAIDTMLALLWSVRTGQLSDTYPALRLDDRTFDTDWRWIGSYSTWRSAILVHLYPENLLLPSLKRRRTPAFKALVQGLRSGSRLSPDSARQLADDYSDYLRDVCSLELGGCVEATTKHFPDQADHAETAARSVEFLFALARSNKVYWCMRDKFAQDREFAQSFWRLLDGFSGLVIDLIGATVQLPSTGSRPTTLHPQLFVFARVAGDSGEALELIRYDLEAGTWHGEAIPLELPGDPLSFTAVLMSTAMTAPPMLEIRAQVREGAAKGEAVYVGSLSQTGNGWDRDSPRLSSVSGTWTPLGQEVSLDNAAAPVVEIRQLLAGDFDGDGRDEILVSDKVTGSDPARGNDYWLLDYANGTWSAQRNLNCSDAAVEARYAFVGDVDGDGRAEVLVAADDSHHARFWVMRYDGTTWHHVGTMPPGSPFDLNCHSWDNDPNSGYQFFVSTEFAVCGRFFDGDDQDSVAIAITPGIHPVGPAAEEIYGGFWIFKLEGGKWKRKGDHTLLHVAFLCCTDLTQKANAAFAVTGDFDGDGRDEIAIAASPKPGAPSLGNDFWVMDFRGGKWEKLGIPGGAKETVFDLGVEPLPAAFAVAGDFDGDGRDELIIAPFVPPTATSSQLWLAEFVPGADQANPAKGGSWKTSTPAGLQLSYVAAAAVAGDFDGDGRDELAILSLTGKTIQIADYLPETHQWQILPPLGELDDLAAPTAFAAAGVFDGGVKAGLAIVPGKQEARTSIVGHNIGNYFGTAQGQKSVSARLFVQTPALAQCSCTDLKPDFEGPYTIRARVDSPTRRALIADTLAKNTAKPLSQQTYLHEAFYSVPLQIALELQRAHNYDAALDWFRLVYDYSQPDGERTIYTGLDEVVLGSTSYVRNLLQWVKDPLDPHAIAATRPGTYARGTLLFLIRCLLDYADAEFTQDTGEAIERARILYETALELMKLPELDQRLGACSDVIARIPLGTTEPALLAAARDLASALPALRSRSAIAAGADAIAVALDRDGTVPERLASAEVALARALSATSRDPALGRVLERATSLGAAGHRQLLQDEGVAHSVASLDGTMSVNSARAPRERSVSSMDLRPSSIGLESSAAFSMSHALDNKHGFCVGPNPILRAIRFHAEVNLFKIRTCRNIAGMHRSLEIYSSPTDQVSGLPMIGLDGQLALPPSGTLTATPYRYSALILRAKELVGYAQQMESLLLSALEKRDVEALTLLKSRQEIQVARAAVRLQELRVTQAEDRVTLAELQKERAAIESDHYQQLLDAGDLELEREALGWLEQAVRYTYTAFGFETAASIFHSFAALLYSVSASGYTAQAVMSFGNPGAIAAAAGATAGAAGATAAAASSTASSFHSLSQAASTWSQIQQMRASRERTRQDWQLRVRLATQDQRVGDQQIRIETDQVRIAQQEFAVSELQAGNAEKLLDFHMQKFTNLDLYDWMSGILEHTYSFMLQQATATAQLAARQLAFERQEGSTPAIQADYWEPAARSTDSANGSATSQERRGLTGSTRLLQDIVQLDQWAFDTNRRKLQLSKTVSLSQLLPLEFEQLRTTGIMTFNVPTQLFDYEFPGHYLRLIKRVSVSVIALVPPSQGIHATLSSNGVSRVVVGPDLFQTVLVRRLPESIALTSPIGSTGIFTFEAQGDLANPFESQGVDTTWEFRMPRAANLFDYNTLADVLVTIDYTALDSVDYRKQVIRQLDRRFTGDRAFSLRRDFPDAWWALHNPDQERAPFATHFETLREDFPPNLQGLEIGDVSLLFVADTPVPAEAVPVSLKFTEKGATAAIGGSATPIERLVSTRRANGGPWRPMTGKTPSGRWELTLVDSPETREWFESEELIDILVVVSYVARTPAWSTQER